jgi:predicted transcriptional regulator
MNTHVPLKLSRRERQIMDVLYARGQATVAEVLENLHDPPSYSAVRALLGILETKGHVKHLPDGPRYIYQPVVSRQKAGQSVMRQVLQVFYGGSLEKAMAALLDASEAKLAPEQRERLEELIRQSRKEGR